MSDKETQKSEEVSSLEELLFTITSERNELQRQIDDSQFKINEIDHYLDSILGEENDDFKLFSPRSAEKVYRKEIEEQTAMKNKLQADIDSFRERCELLDRYIHSLKHAIRLSDEKKKKNVRRETKSRDSESTIMDVQERERQRIANDLHDTSLQNLTHLVHKVELASMYIDKDPIQAKLELATISKQIKGIIDNIRNTIFNLRPMSFDDLGFQATIERAVTRYKEIDSSFDIVLDIEESRLDSTGVNSYFVNTSDDNKVQIHKIEITIYRIIQEAIINSLKHSGGNRIDIKIKKVRKNCVITIADNGTGFNTDDVSRENHYGIIIMKERAELVDGKVEIHSDSKGTVVEVTIPLL